MLVSPLRLSATSLVQVPFINPQLTLFCGSLAMTYPVFSTKELAVFVSAETHIRVS